MKKAFLALLLLNACASANPAAPQPGNAKIIVSRHFTLQRINEGVGIGIDGTKRCELAVNDECSIELPAGSYHAGAHARHVLGNEESAAYDVKLKAGEVVRLEVGYGCDHWGAGGVYPYTVPNCTGALYLWVK